MKQLYYTVLRNYCLTPSVFKTIKSVCKKYNAQAERLKKDLYLVTFPNGQRSIYYMEVQ